MGAVASLPLSMLLVLLNFLLFLQPTHGQSPSPTPTAAGPSVISQPIIHPARRDILAPGTTFTITWLPNPHFKNVTLQLWDKTSWGYSRDLLTGCIPWLRNPFCGTIAKHAPNTGTYDWMIPNPQNGSLGFGFPRDDRVFWIKMYVEDYVNTDIGNQDPVLSYSQNFAFAKPGESGTTVTDTMTSSDGSNMVTVYVTADGTMTSGGGATGATTTPSVTGGAPKNGTGPLAAQGAATRLQRSIPGALLLLLGLI